MRSFKKYPFPLGPVELHNPERVEDSFLCLKWSFYTALVGALVLLALRGLSQG
ncbi:MAG: hypothetical protein AAB523_03630 [Patescibacteria group bacterium]